MLVSDLISPQHFSPSLSSLVTNTLICINDQEINEEEQKGTWKHSSSTVNSIAESLPVDCLFPLLSQAARERQKWIFNASRTFTFAWSRHSAEPTPIYLEGFLKIQQSFKLSRLQFKITLTVKGNSGLAPLFQRDPEANPWCHQHTPLLVLGLIQTNPTWELPQSKSAHQPPGPPASSHSSQLLHPGCSEAGCAPG